MPGYLRRDSYDAQEPLLPNQPVEHKQNDEQTPELTHYVLRDGLALARVEQPSQARQDFLLARESQGFEQLESRFDEFNKIHCRLSLK